MAHSDGQVGFARIIVGREATGDDWQVLHSDVFATGFDYCTPDKWQVGSSTSFMREQILEMTDFPFFGREEVGIFEVHGQFNAWAEEYETDCGREYDGGVYFFNPAKMKMEAKERDNFAYAFPEEWTEYAEANGLELLEGMKLKEARDSYKELDVYLESGNGANFVELTQNLLQHREGRLKVKIGHGCVNITDTEFSVAKFIDKMVESFDDGF